MHGVDVFWSFRSPYSYLAIPDLLALREDYEVSVNLRVVLPIAVRTKATLFDRSNPKPAMYIVMDAFRRAEMLNRPIHWPSPDPIVQNFETLEVAEEQPYIYRISYLGVEAARRGCALELAEALSTDIWSGAPGWNEEDRLAATVGSVGHTLEDMEQAIAGYDVQAIIEDNHAALDSAGHWGVPTCVFNNEPFFGQDRIDTLRWRLDQAGVAKR